MDDQRGEEGGRKQEEGESIKMDKKGSVLPPLQSCLHLCGLNTRVQTKAGHVR